MAKSRIAVISESWSDRGHSDQARSWPRGWTGTAVLISFTMYRVEFGIVMPMVAAFIRE